MGLFTTCVELQLNKHCSSVSILHVKLKKKFCLCISIKRIWRMAHSTVNSTHYRNCLIRCM